MIHKQRNELNVSIERVKVTKQIVRVNYYDSALEPALVASDVTTEVVDIAPVTNVNLTTRNNKIVSSGRLALGVDVILTGQETFDAPSTWVYDGTATPKVYSL